MTSLMVWFFAEETLKVFLSLNAYVTFNEILLLFREPQMDALVANRFDTVGILRASYKRNNNR